MYRYYKLVFTWGILYVREDNIDLVLENNMKQGNEPFVMEGII